MGAALAGVSVVELGATERVGYAGRLLCDLGAEVTRVAFAGDGVQTVRVDDAPLDLYLNAGKERLTVRSHDDAAVVLANFLAQSTLVFWEPFAGTSGIDIGALLEAHPHLVRIAVSPFGREHGRRALPADDLTLQACGGLSLGIGLPGKPPLKLPGDQSAFQAGLAAAIAGVGALFARRGVAIDIAVADVWAAFYSGVDVALAHFGRHRKRRAGHRVSGQPYPRTLFRCSDGYFAVQCGESRHWQSFLRMIGREDLQTHPFVANRFKANDEHGDACDALIEPWFLYKTKDEVLRQCLEFKIPGAPVYDVREVLEHPHLRERGCFVEIETGRGSLRVPGSPFAGLARPVHPSPSRAPKDERDSVGSRAQLPPPRALGKTGRAEERARLETRTAERTPVRPLSGLRVVDFGWVWAGAVPGHILADMGAEVIKVESASPLDYMRQGRPIVGTQKDPEQNPMFHNVNRGKSSLRVKLDHPEAKRVLTDLVAKSDVVIENFSPGVMDKFGLGFAELQRVRPDLVMCSMSAVGQQGPLRGIRTYATMIASLAGLDSLVGYAGGRVLGSQSSYADPNASLHATVGILAALWRRHETGEGAYLDLSQWEAAVSVMGAEIAAFGMNGDIPRPCGTEHARKAPHGHYPSAGNDRWIAISVENDGQWRALAEALGNPQALLMEDWATARGRSAHRAALDEALARETVRHDAGTLASALANVGVPAAPLLDASELQAHPHFRARELFEEVAHPVLGSVPVYRLPWHIDGKPVPITRRAPLLGEHNEDVLARVLDYTQARTDALRESGVFA